MYYAVVEFLIICIRSVGMLILFMLARKKCIIQCVSVMSISTRTILYAKDLSVYKPRIFIQGFFFQFTALNPIQMID